MSIVGTLNQLYGTSSQLDGPCRLKTGMLTLLEYFEVLWDTSCKRRWKFCIYVFTNYHNLSINPSNALFSRNVDMLYYLLEVITCLQMRCSPS